MILARHLNLKKLLEKKSHFLFGPRGTGKTSLIKEELTDKAQIIDLLSDDAYSLLLRRPSALEELIRSSTKIIVIDEIQKIPQLLDEVHRLIESRKVKFLLTGSSARKLRHGGANLLGGRAWESQIFPLTSSELGKEFDLIKYLNVGGLPGIYFSDYPRDELKNYTRLYLREEIQAEALVRKLDHFTRFLDTMALCNGEELNFEGIASDAAIPARTVSSYVEILEDTLIGYQVQPFTKSKTRKAIKRAKFYFFDVGVVGALARRGEIVQNSELFGRAFENFVAQELRAYLSYNNRDEALNYWRTTSQLEVDFIVGDSLAVEVKGSGNVSRSSLSALRALAEEKLVRKLVVVSQEKLEREVEGIRILPWRIFLDELWEGRLIG